MNDAGVLADAAAAIHDGRLVAFATETVYGLGGDATNPTAVARIFAAKNRPSFNPLISHYSSISAVRDDAVLNAQAMALADAFWPGPLTLVAPKSATCRIAALATAGLDTVAVRVPQAPLAQRFLDACGVPVAAPSANRSGGISPTRAEHVQASLPGPDGGGPVLVLDGGPCTVGLESTVVDVTTATPTILRHGGIAQGQIEAVLGPVAVAGSDDGAPKSPGMLSRHYAPKATLRLNADAPGPEEVFLAFGDIGGPSDVNLSPRGDLTEAAANLFDMLHRLDGTGVAGIAVAPIPETGLGIAINDRLHRGRS